MFELLEPEMQNLTSSSLSFSKRYFSVFDVPRRVRGLDGKVW